MKTTAYILFVLLAVVLFAACKKDEKLTKEPKIEYINVAPNTIKASSGEDTLNISFKVWDGDADLGNDQVMGGPQDIYLKDSRDSSVLQYYFPELSQNVDPNKGFEATVILNINAAFLALRDDSLHTERDTLQYEIYVVDRAGHESNKITTDPIYLVK